MIMIKKGFTYNKLQKYHKNNKTFTVINIFIKFYGKADAHRYLSVARPTSFTGLSKNVLLSQGLR